MLDRFRTQAAYYLRLAELADEPEDRAELVSLACAWHRLAQDLDLRHARQDGIAEGVRGASRAA